MDEKQLVVFKLGSEEYGIDITQVREIIRYVNSVKVPQALDYIEGIINLRGKIIPVISLAKRFQLRHSVEVDSRVVIVELPEQDLGLVVDKVTEVMRLNDKQIKETPPLAANGNQFIAGICQDGERTIIVLDISKLLDEKEIHNMRHDLFSLVSN